MGEKEGEERKKGGGGRMEEGGREIPVCTCKNYITHQIH